MPRTKKPASLDAAGRAQARKTIADFVKIAHTVEAWSGRDEESVALMPVAAATPLALVN